MSFVYAINRKNFMIMSDMKITFNEGLMRQWRSEDKIKSIEQFGMIKSIIINPHLVICFAGNNIDKAAELIRKIKNKEQELENILKLAFDIHLKSKDDDIEFLICYCKNKRELISIKNRQIIRNCEIAWIGSITAYKELKKLESKIPIDKIKGRSTIVVGNNNKAYQESIDEEITYEMEMESIFEKVLESNIDDTVGDMPVRITMLGNEDHFEYMGCIRCIMSSWPQTVKPQENCLLFEGVGKGSFCCNVYCSVNNYCYYIYEAGFGVIYTDKENFADGLSGLKFPELYHVDIDTFDKIALENGAYKCFDLL